MTSRPSSARCPVQPFSPRRLAATALLGASALLPLSGCKGHGPHFSSISHLFHSRKAKSKPNSTDYASNLQTITGNPHIAFLKQQNFADFQPQVQGFYNDRDWELAWTRDGKPTEAATRLIQLFGDAAKKGLRPEDYDSSRWPQLTARLDTIRSSHDTSDDANNTVAEFDAAMTVTAMRYLSDLHLGRINPQSLNFDIDVPARRAQFDIATLLNDQLVDATDVTSVVDSVEPGNPIYKKTEEALPHYLELAKQQAAQPGEPLPDVSKTISPGGTYAAVGPLEARLALEGDGQPPAQGQAPSDRYTPEIAGAVQQFQSRHGLKPDGKLDKDTVEALNVPMSTRVQQIDDSLERWRWLPDNFIKPRVLVNLPEYYVRTFDPNGDLVFKMKVVDGQNKDNHDTPIFVRTMRFLIFRPFWNLPTDIVKKDLLKHASKGYFDAHGYEVVTRDGKAVDNWTVDDLEHARYMVRQKPGPKNSLGLVKFMFPNEYDIYMHSTPEMNLFNLTDRDRSHGCVRLNDAEKMADWVLNGQGDWTPDKIHVAMYGVPLNGDNSDAQTPDTAKEDASAKSDSNADNSAGKPSDGSNAQYPDLHDNKQVNLQTQLPVVITYLTANADEDGTVHFFRDVYGYDKDLEAALAQPRPYEQQPVKINPKLPVGGTD